MERSEDKKNYPDYIEKTYDFIIPAGQRPERVDVFLTEAIPNATRSKVQAAIDAGNVTINGKIHKSSRKIQPGDTVKCSVMKPPPMELLPENIPLDITYEDEYLLVVNKPSGMVTHPGFGNRYGTLVNALLYHFGQREAIPIEDIDDDEENETEGEEEGETTYLYNTDAIRPGIVHRLDKETSGLLVVAKNPIVHAALAKQFSEHTTQREYNAIVWGIVKENEGRIESMIGRSASDRKKFAVVKKDGKLAITDYTVIERHEFLTLIRFKLHTGRTHQIRVHATSMHHPLLGDSTYGGDSIAYGGLKNTTQKSLALRCLDVMQRQALHARTLGFTHPHTGARLEFEAELPADFKQILAMVHKD